MKKIVALFLFLTLCSFAAHKFYVSIYKIDYNAKKQRLEITTRIFIDDLNRALKKKYGQTTHLGEPTETPEDVQLMNKYLLEHFSVLVNQKKQTYQYVSHEYENQVILGYYKINGLTKVSSVQIQNMMLVDVFPEQQNIVQSQINHKKQSLLLTAETTSGLLK